MKEQIFLPIVLGSMLNFFARDTINQVKDYIQLKDQQCLRFPLAEALHYIMNKLFPDCFELQSIIKFAVSSLLLLLTLFQLKKSQTNKESKKTMFIQLYCYLLDPLIHINFPSDNCDYFNNLVGTLVMISISLVNNTCNQKLFVLSCLIITLLQPFIGLCLIMSYTQLFSLFKTSLFSITVPIYYIYCQFIKHIEFNDLVQQLIQLKKQRWVLYQIIPNNNLSSMIQLCIFLILITSNLFAKKYTPQKCFYLFAKSILLYTIFTSHYISSAVIQSLAISSLTFDQNNIFIVIYSLFIQISNSLTTANQNKMMHYLIGSFILHLGLVGFLIKYMNIRLFKLNTIFFMILVVFPISILVFSQLSRFKVLRILEEAFTLAFSFILLIYMEIKFWGKEAYIKKFVDNQTNEQTILAKYQLDENYLPNNNDVSPTETSELFDSKNSDQTQVQKPQAILIEQLLNRKLD